MRPDTEDDVGLIGQDLIHEDWNAVEVSKGWHATYFTVREEIAKFLFLRQANVLGTHESTHLGEVQTVGG